MMAVKSPITDQLIQECIVKSVQSVFHTMVGHELAFIEQQTPVAPPTGLTPCHIVGSVGFVGEMTGLIYLCLSEDFAKTISSHMLGMSLAEVEMHGNEVIHDAIGEITNMTVGGFKNTLCDLGFPCKLTLPTIVRGDNLSIAAVKSATRHIFHFDCKGHRLIADIQVKFD